MGITVKPAVNLAAYPLDPMNLEQLKAWMIGAAGQNALDATKNAYSNYVAGPFNSWFASYDAGRAEEPPPAPPAGFVAVMSDDGMSWDLNPGDVPSGPVPAYKKRNIYPTGTPGVNPFANLTSRSLLVAAVGGRATQSDGTIWVRIA
jgi:hypothetical protein